MRPGEGRKRPNRKEGGGWQGGRGKTARDYNHAWGSPTQGN